ncbi:hypothetical protein TNCT_528141 [Trichonephila clavata]|uniref:Uncharacterized protein n=1 Tax=Trichonephila clavata TaxID=2740835 RepID=A0A8X6JAV5_TRICU|nr:hypothetical protein TNCT_528141 [Trichonephila clavata]
MVKAFVCLPSKLLPWNTFKSSDRQKRTFAYHSNLKIAVTSPVLFKGHGNKSRFFWVSFPLEIVSEKLSEKLLCGVEYLLTKPEVILWGTIEKLK